MAHVVITGFGAISPLGLNAEQMWEGLNIGRCGIGEITHFDPTGFDCKIGGQIPAYNIWDYVPKAYRRKTKLMSSQIELAVISADQAFRHSGLVTKGINTKHFTINPKRTAICVGAGMMSCDLVELAPAVAVCVKDGYFSLKEWGMKGIEFITPSWMLRYLPNIPACHVSIIHDIQGSSNTITCAESSSILAISEAVRIIRRGAADVALAGGTDNLITPHGIIRQYLLGRICTVYNHIPSFACRPFDNKAMGSVFGGAGAMVVLEDLEFAQQRGAMIYAEVVGVGSSHCIHPDYKGLEPDGTALRIAIERTLEDAKLGPQDIDLLIPHGTGIMSDDLAEARAIKAALGTAVEKIHVWPTKSMLSNTGAAAGTLDVIASICAMKHSTIPSAHNFESPAEGCCLHIVNKPYNTVISHVLCCSYTYGGQTAAIILKNLSIKRSR